MAEQTPAGAGRNVFRQRGAVGIGIAVIALMAVMLVIFAFDGGIDLAVTSWMVAGAVLLWLLFVRPSVRLAQDGVRLDNLIRVTHLSWSAIDLIETRWNLTLVTHDGKTFSAWAISAQRPRAEKSGRARFGMLAGTGLPESPKDLRHRPSSAGDVQRSIAHGQEGYDRAVAAGLLEPQPQVVERSWSPIALAGWAVFVVLLLVGAFA
ncbi:PH domain-containing protein [Calidifontibacter terrae]